jgi:hypothetical protein
MAISHPARDFGRRAGPVSHVFACGRAVLYEDLGVHVVPGASVAMSTMPVMGSFE